MVVLSFTTLVWKKRNSQYFKVKVKLVFTLFDIKEKKDNFVFKEETFSRRIAH